MAAQLVMVKQVAGSRSTVYERSRGRPCTRCWRIGSPGHTDPASRRRPSLAAGSRRRVDRHLQMRRSPPTGRAIAVRRMRWARLVAPAESGGTAGEARQLDGLQADAQRSFADGTRSSRRFASRRNIPRCSSTSM